jgi:hypothetical protein
MTPGFLTVLPTAAATTMLEAVGDETDPLFQALQPRRHWGQMFHEVPP